MAVPFLIDLKDKVAVVTGGGGILCSVMAKALAKAAIYNNQLCSVKTNLSSYE